MPDQPLPLPFPLGGIDLSRGREHQKLGTAAEGVNVRVCEPSTLRQRGGARPGLVKYIPGQIPEGREPFQELNFVVIASADALPTGIEDPGQPTDEDGSSVGPSGSWGTGSVYIDPYTGDPVTGADEGTRNPYNSGGRSLRRHRGSGYQPNKNVVTRAPISTEPDHHCFQGSITIRITKPAPDPLFWTGQEPDFVGSLCSPYVAGNPVYHGPQTGGLVKRIITDADSDEGTILLDHIAYWLWNHVGTDSFGTVITDLIGTPSVGLCTGSGDCGGAPPPSVGGTGVGAVIIARAPGT